MRKNNFLNILYSFIILFILDYFVYDKYISSLSIDFFVSFLLFLIAYVISVQLHEFGHFLFGKLMGYELRAYRIFIFLWRKIDSKLKFSISKVSGYHGYCFMVPKKEPTKYNKIIFALGGVCINFITGMTTLLIYPYLNTYNIILAFLLLFSLVSLYNTIYNLLPIYFNNNPSDGMSIIYYLLNKPFPLDIRKQHQQLIAGTRPKELDLSYSMDIKNLDGSHAIVVILLYFKALDSQDNDKMVYYMKHLEKNLNSTPVNFLITINYEICFMACISNDIDKAKKYYSRIKSNLDDDQDLNGLRIKAYYEYYINHHLPLALKYCQDAELVKDSFSIKGQGMMEIDLIHRLKVNIENKQYIDKD